MKILVLMLALWSALLTYDRLQSKVQDFDVINVGRINVREKDGTLRAALSNSAGFNEGQRSNVKFAGLMFYNEEGQEEGGLTYSGRAKKDGQDADVTLAMDQYRQDQNVYLHHEEEKDATHTRLEDGLSINARPDWTNAKEEFKTYGQIDKLPKAEGDALRLEAAKAGKVSTSRIFLGVQRGVANSKPYDNTGIFIRNQWGKNAVALYVGTDNKPHLRVYDELGKSVVYELKLEKEKAN